MPLSEAGSGYGINFDATKENFPRSLYFSPSHDLPLEGNFKILFGSTHKNGPANSLLSEGLRKNFSGGLIFHRSRELPLEREKVFSGTPKNTHLNLLASEGVPQEHPIPSPEKEVISNRQLNNRHRKRYDRATTSKERARRRRGDPGAGTQKPYREDGALFQ